MGILRCKLKTSTSTFTIPSFNPISETTIFCLIAKMGNDRGLKFQVLINESGMKPEESRQPVGMG